MAYLNKNKYEDGGYNFIGSYMPSQKRVDEYLQENPRQERVQLSEKEIRELSRTAEGRERLFRMRNPNTFVTSEQAKNMPIWYRQQNPDLNRIIIDDSLERKLRSKNFRKNLSQEDRIYIEELLQTKKGKVPAVITYNPTEYYKGDVVGSMLFDELPGKSFQDESAKGSRSASKNLIQQLEKLIKNENVDSGMITLPMRTGFEDIQGMRRKPEKLPSFKEQTNPMTFTDSDRDEQDMLDRIGTVSVNQEEMNRLNAPKKVEVNKKNAPVISPEMNKVTGPKKELVDEEPTNLEKAQATMDSVRNMVNMNNEIIDPSSYEISDDEYVPQSMREEEEYIPQSMRYEDGGPVNPNPDDDPDIDDDTDTDTDTDTNTDDITEQQLEEIKQLREDMLAMQQQLNAQQNPMAIVQKNKSRYPNLFQLNQAKLGRIFG